MLTLGWSATDALVEDYEGAQLGALKAGLLASAFLALAALAFTREPPHAMARAATQHDASALGVT